MKNGITAATLLGLIILLSPVASSAQDPKEVVASYFQAMKNGDVLAMKSYIGGKLYEKRKILLEQNANYSEFLRNHYEYGDIQVGEVHNGVVKVIVQFPDGRINARHLVVEQDSDGDWKIVNEISRDR